MINQKSLTKLQNVDICNFIAESKTHAEDLASGKNVLELCNHPEQLTLNSFDGYDGQSGYCGTHHPTCLTVDLKHSYDIGLIQFLLMDQVADTNHGSDERLYYFRVLVADDYTEKQNENYTLDKDRIVWKVLYDSQHRGFRNWQFIHVTGGVKARFVRIHCVYNSKNAGFHVVRLRAYDTKVADSVDYHGIRAFLANPLPNGFVIDPAGMSQIVTVNGSRVVSEIGDGFPLSKRIYDIANLTKQISDSSSRDYLQYNIEDKYLRGINSIVTDVLEARRQGVKVNVTGDDIYKILTSIADDIVIVERNSKGMQRVILDPVNMSLDKGNRFDKVWTILSVFFMVVPWVILYWNKIF